MKETIMKKPDRMVGVRDSEWNQAMSDLKSASFYRSLPREFELHPNKVAEKNYRITNTLVLSIRCGFGSASASIPNIVSYKESYGSTNATSQYAEDAVRKVCEKAAKFLKAYS